MLCRTGTPVNKLAESVYGSPAVHYSAGDNQIVKERTNEPNPKRKKGHCLHSPNEGMYK
jgi:hypothetical protein